MYCYAVESITALMSGDAVSAAGMLVAKKADPGDRQSQRSLSSLDTGSCFSQSDTSWQTVVRDATPLFPFM